MNRPTQHNDSWNDAGQAHLPLQQVNCNGNLNRACPHLVHILHAKAYPLDVSVHQCQGCCLVYRIAGQCQCCVIDHCCQYSTGGDYTPVDLVLVKACGDLGHRVRFVICINISKPALLQSRHRLSQLPLSDHIQYCVRNCFEELQQNRLRFGSKMAAIN